MKHRHLGKLPDLSSAMLRIEERVLETSFWAPGLHREAQEPLAAAKSFTDRYKQL